MAWIHFEDKLAFTRQIESKSIAYLSSSDSGWGFSTFDGVLVKNDLENNRDKLTTRNSFVIESLRYGSLRHLRGLYINIFHNAPRTLHNNLPPNLTNGNGIGFPLGLYLSANVETIVRLINVAFQSDSYRRTYGFISCIEYLLSIA